MAVPLAHASALGSLAALALCAGCSGGPPAAMSQASGVQATVSGEAQLLPAPWTPPPDWRQLRSVEFERLLDREFAAGAVSPAPRALDDLGQGLAESPAVATRAAILLARSGAPAARELLLQRLEQRHAGDERDADVGDATAARALGRGPGDPGTVERLVALAAGSQPHPDLEVRVECAIAALAAQRTEGVEFLLAVLRIDTDEARRRGERLTTSTATAWARGRAAEALCALAGRPHRLWTEAPLAVREERALELERWWRAR
jgi:hypothetical protein